MKNILHWCKPITLCALLISANVDAEDWITEEVLKQLSEVRQELKVLQGEVRSLKEQFVADKNVAAVKKTGGLSIDISGSPTVGKSDASYAIVEFSDYQCPYCKRHYSQTLPQIKETLVDTGKVKYVMKQFPLGFHAKARGASIAALCVERLKPDSYWKAHESIFTGQTQLDRESYNRLASVLEIDQSKFEACLSNSEISQLVDLDMHQGESVGVSGTPAFLIGKLEGNKIVNGQLLTGARPYSSFSSIIEGL